MSTVVYSASIADAREARALYQARGAGASVVTHDRGADLAAEPDTDVDVVPYRNTLLDRGISALRRLRHPYPLPYSTEQQVIDRLCLRSARMIHAHHGLGGMRMASPARRMACALVVTFHGEDAYELPEQDPAYRRALPALFHQARRILTVSRKVYDRVIELGCPREKAELVPFGVSMPALRPRRGANREVVRAIAVTPLHPSRGIPGLVDAVALSRRMGAPIELDIVGDGPEYADIARRIEYEGVGAIVRLLGERPHAEVDLLLQRSDVYVHNGRTANRRDLDGPPEPMLRAMAAGLCVVASEHGGVTEVVRDDVSGLLVPEYDTPAMVRALVRTTKDPALRVALGAAGRVRVERDFNAARSVARLRELYL